MTRMGRIIEGANKGASFFYKKRERRDLHRFPKRGGGKRRTVGKTIDVGTMPGGGSYIAQRRMAPERLGRKRKHALEYLHEQKRRMLQNRAQRIKNSTIGLIRLSGKREKTTTTERRKREKKKNLNPAQPI